MKKLCVLMLAAVMLLVGCAPVQNNAGDKDLVIGIAWRKDVDSEFFTNVCRAIEQAGGKWVKLEQVTTKELSFDGSGSLTSGVAETGALDAETGALIRKNTWHNSNAEAAVKNVDMVIFTGGEDISPSLYAVQEEWHGIEAEKDYNAERDVSDFLTMSYCLDKDIPMLGFCRGMQMLAVVSGGETIQDIPTYFSEMGVEYSYQHRNEKATPESYRDYAPHTVTVEKNSFLYEIFGTESLEGCPSWHHQAVKSVDNNHLTVTGYTDTNGIRMIEAVERTDKTFAVGLQFHPEAAVVKNLDNAANKGDFMSLDTALSVFKYILQQKFIEQQNAA
ncbi:MAG: gamma-glutamyl-gamma-aminobutyrate hydrolase family protein [Clostridia bacterium]|nr:gamma-glutamyl-gamma-aminobutyrate hydrolase family protein [Clostridia bacterium]